VAVPLRVPDATVTVELDGPLDLYRTLRPVGGKGALGAVVARGGELWRAEHTPAGPATVRLRPVPGGVTAAAWGSGAASALERVPGLVGLFDEPGRLVPRDPLVARLVARFPGHRLTCTGTIWEHLPPTILGQKVQTESAEAAWQHILWRFGRRPPGPAPGTLVLAPTAEDWCCIGYHELHPFGVERRRAEVVTRAARLRGRLEEAASLKPEAARRRLQAVPGIGPWTAAFVTQLSHGDPDAVIVGDYNLPRRIAWAFARERTATDERMLELLEPYRGQRARVQLLVKLGTPKPPRRGPHLPLADFADR
jgi:endonuclease III